MRRARYDLGWLTNVARPVKNGTYALAAIEHASKLPQTLVVTTANDQYWIEYRSRAAETYDGQHLAGSRPAVRQVEVP